mgnify:CR=1 FL=1|tara:strand:- start:243 stop:425 length:183 start_codon:yes stop_codon:yes gene_type:complete
MPQFKYICYLAIIGAVLLDLYAANPNAGQSARLILDVTALLFAVAGLAGLAMGGESARRR